MDTYGLINLVQEVIYGNELLQKVPKPCSMALILVVQIAPKELIALAAYIYWLNKKWSTKVTQHQSFGLTKGYTRIV